MNTNQIDLLHSLYTTMINLMTAEVADHKRFEKSCRVSAALMDENQIPFYLQNLVAEAAADGADFPIRAHLMPKIAEAYSALPQPPQSVDQLRSVLELVLGFKLTRAETVAASHKPKH